MLECRGSAILAVLPVVCQAMRGGVAHNGGMVRMGGWLPQGERVQPSIESSMPCLTAGRGEGMIVVGRVRGFVLETTA